MNLRFLISLESRVHYMVILWERKVKWCFAKADTWRNISLKQIQVKGCFDIANMWKYKYNPTESRRWALNFDVVCSALVFFTKDMHVLVRLIHHCWAQLVITQPLRETCLRTACEVPEAAFCFCSLIPGQVVRLLVSSGLTNRCLMSDVSLLKGLDYSCWFVYGVC